jgi:hypothetical protein
MPNAQPQFQFHAEPYPILQFSFCSTKIHADIRVPQSGSWISDVEGESDEEGEWERKDNERLLWKAMNTGMHHAGRGGMRTVHSD